MTAEQMQELLDEHKSELVEASEYGRKQLFDLVSELSGCPAYHALKRSFIHVEGIDYDIEFFDEQHDRFVLVEA